jgi:hypothetical protein
MESFYATLAGICFSALGLWWVVVQFKYERWTGTAGRRAAAGAITGQLIALGLISLIAVMSSELQTIWRLGSIAGGMLGAIVSLYAAFKAATTGLQRTLGFLSAALFVFTVLTAFVFGPLFEVKPILVGALIDAAVLGLSIWQAWLYMMEA